MRARKQLLEPGHAVWLYNPTRRIGVCSKLNSKWKGPYVVIRKLDDVTYLGEFILINYSHTKSSYMVRQNKATRGKSVNNNGHILDCINSVVLKVIKYVCCISQINLRCNSLLQ